MKSGKTKDVLGGIIDELIKYTVVHFKEEEDIFSKFSYQETDEHKAEHQNFVNEVAKFKEAFDNKKVVVSLEIMIFLRDWLYKHILKTDKKYMPFMKENNIR